MSKTDKNTKKKPMEDIDGDENGVERNEKEHEPNAKSRANDSGRRTFGFPCHPHIAARTTMLAAQLQIDVSSLSEHSLQTANELVSWILEDPAQAQELRQHIAEFHVAQRTIEEVAGYDEGAAEMLKQEWKQRYRYDSAVRRLVVKYRRRIQPEDIEMFLEYGLECWLADNKSLEARQLKSAVLNAMSSEKSLEGDLNGQGFCVKCRVKREIKNGKATKMKNGKPATQGVCPVCGTMMFRIGKA